MAAFVLIREVLQRALKRAHLEPVYWLAQIQLNWVQIVGPKVAEKSQPVKFKKGVLTIAAANSSWMNELQMMKPILEGKIKQHYAELKLEKIKLIQSYESLRG